MAGVTPNGFIAKEFQQLIDEVAAAAKQEIGQDFPTTPDSAFGQLSNIFMAATEDTWQLGQAIAEAGNRDTANGIYLDYLARLIGLTREQASGSVGDLVFTGQQGALIPVFFPVADDLGRNVLTQQDLELNRAGCYQSTFSVEALIDNADYTINVEGLPYTYNGGISPSVSNIVNGLDAALSSGGTFTSEVVNDEIIIITYESRNNLLTTTNSSNLNLDSIGGVVEGQAADVGSLEFPANTVNTLVGSNLLVDSVTNPSDFSVGRLLETDEELRRRMAEREQSTGTATKPSIEASISQVPGVSSVLVIENITLTDDVVTGVPAKSYETFVTGGSNDAIAEVLWETKPATGQTFGDITEVITDRNGDSQAVSFSRQSQQYAWMVVTYTINQEELFPANGEEAMANNVVSFGNSLASGEDYEPTKFYAPLYQVHGVYITNIEIAVTTLPGDSPVYQTTRIPVGVTETLQFDTSRITITT